MWLGLVFAAQDERVWPVSFVVAYIRDAASLRTWVDSPQCQLFRDNVLTAFITTSAASCLPKRRSSTHGSPPTLTSDLGLNL